ncbi:hypothetical protein CAPTEDRAFT_195285, partial [Capitella teleta]
MAVFALRVVILTELLIICEGQGYSQSVRPGPFADRYMGCYADEYERALQIEAYNYSSIAGIYSNGRCIRECSGRGYTFAGTEASYECFCGNNYDYGRHGQTQGDCIRLCQRNDAETCGGNWHIQIYSVCPTGKYNGTGDAVINDKPNCENECHCKALPCVYTNGTCPDGCDIGWKGDACNER